MKLFLQIFFIIFLALSSCSDPVAEARKAYEKAQVDSLRADIKASRLRIDSLRKASDSIRAIVDSLDMGNKKP